MATIVGAHNLNNDYSSQIDTNGNTPYFSVNTLSSRHSPALLFSNANGKANNLMKKEVQFAPVADEDTDMVQQ